MTDYKSMEELKEFLHDSVLVITGKKIYGLYKDIFPENTLILPVGENAKTLTVVKKILEEMHTRGLNVSDTVVAVGGGAIGDTVGFAASIYHRGMPWINVPTTLLSLCDSSVGGKTSVNFMGCKNVIGSFWNPTKRIVCKKFLNTLSKKQLASGLGEIIKTSFLNADFYGYVKNTYKLYEYDKQALFAAAIEASRIKAKIVAKDFRCESIRNNLNIGHTIGHALEAAYKYEHGIAVCMGIQIAMEMFKDSIERGFLEEARVMCRRLAKIPNFSADKLITFLRADKKNRNGDIVLLLPVRPGDTIPVNLKEEKFYALLQKLEEELKA